MVARRWTLCVLYHDDDECHGRPVGQCIVSRADPFHARGSQLTIHETEQTPPEHGESQGKGSAGALESMLPSKERASECT